jgi:iron(III) transport system substrate-binding protein
VVVYSSVDDVFAPPIAERFTRETGIRVELVPDTEETKSTGLLNRLIAERDRPRADVFWSGDPVRAAVLKSKGVSDPYHSVQARSLPKLFSDPDGHWTGFSARARVLLVNVKAFPDPKDRPTSVFDLADARYQGKGCLANPLFGTTSMHAAALFAELGEEKARETFERFHTNRARMLSSNGEVRRKVSSGECAFGLTDTDDAAEAVREGKPVAVVYPDAKGMGTLVVPNAVVLIRNAPHAELGRKFIDFLLSPEVEQALAESDAAQMPVRKGVKTPPHVLALSSLKPMRVNYSRLGGILELQSRGFLKEWASR